MILDPEEAADRLRDFQRSLDAIYDDTTGTADYSYGHQRLDRLHERIVTWLTREVSNDLARKLRNDVGSTLQRSQDSFNFRVDQYSAFVQSLIGDMDDDPEHWDAVLAEHSDDEEGDDWEETSVFVAHGRSLDWLVIERFLKSQLEVTTVVFESESRVGLYNLDVVEEAMAACDAAVIVMTAEDATDEGQLRARQNVIHEAGLAQSHFGRERAVLLVQHGTELPSNLDGIQTIRFPAGEIRQCFEDLRRFLEREELI